jgi:hypothetical protein
VNFSAKLFFLPDCLAFSVQPQIAYLL